MKSWKDVNRYSTWWAWCQGDREGPSVRYLGEVPGWSNRMCAVCPPDGWPTGANRGLMTASLTRHTIIVIVKYYICPVWVKRTRVHDFYDQQCSRDNSPCCQCLQERLLPMFQWWKNNYIRVQPIKVPHRGFHLDILLICNNPLLVLFYWFE